MKADATDIARLLELQHVDIELMRAQKIFDELPQRAQILEIRKKKQAVEQKRDQILAMKKEVDSKASRLKDEDERLSIKLGETQEKINASQGDYRSVEALSKELNGISKRRTTLEGEISEAQAQLTNIEQVEQQIKSAFESLVVQENGFVASFQKEGSTLTGNLAVLNKRRKELSEALASEYIDTYEKIARRSGGIALARLQNATCSVCRNALEEGKLLQVQAEAPISTCPSCKRMLVVEQ